MKISKSTMPLYAYILVMMRRSIEEERKCDVITNWIETNLPKCDYAIERWPWDRMIYFKFEKDVVLLKLIFS